MNKLNIYPTLEARINGERYTICYCTLENEKILPYFGVDTDKKIISIYNTVDDERIRRFILDAQRIYKR